MSNEVDLLRGWPRILHKSEQDTRLRQDFRSVFELD